MLCYNGFPNWFGWVPIGFIGLLGVGIVMGFLGTLIRHDVAERKLKLNNDA